MISNTKILGFFFLSLLISCAQQTSPTGGPKDEDPPLLMESNPAKNELNYKGKIITLTFDETVIVSNPKEQLIITPSIGTDYEIVAKKNKVLLTMQNPLQDSTTYAFNFGESIQDITEKNPAENLSIAFSTGPVIDSLSVAGYVFDLLKGNPLEKMVVALYPKTDTFNIFKHKPSYITRTQKDGSYVITNLKKGTYMIYAFHDKNRNLVVDSRSEMYGFKVAPIILENNINDIAIDLSPMDLTELKITRARPYSNYFNINLSKNSVDYSVSAIDTTLNIISAYGENKANIITYNTTQTLDSLNILLHVKDSIGNKLDTVFYIKYSERNVTPEKFTVNNVFTNVYTEKGLIEASFKFNKPIYQPNLDSLYIHIDSTTQIHFAQEDLLIDSKLLTLTIKKNFDKKILEKPEVENPQSNQPINNTRKKGEPLTLEERVNLEEANKKTSEQKNFLLQGKGAFISIDDDSSTVAKPKIKLLKTKDLSVIIVKIKTEENFIVNLLSKDFVQVQSVANNSDIRFEDVPPGDYRIQVIIDKNKNGKWDAGNIIETREPEPVIFYSTEKDIMFFPAKANWEIGPLLITY